MWEWLREHVPGYDSTLGAIIGGGIGVALFLAGRWALYRDRMTNAEAERWRLLQRQLTTYEARHAQHEIRLGQMMTRHEVTQTIDDAMQRSGQQVAAVITTISGRLDRMDQRADRMEQRRAERDRELLETMQVLLVKSERRREDFSGERRRARLVDPDTAADKDHGTE